MSQKILQTGRLSHLLTRKILQYDFYSNQGLYTVSLRAGSGESEFVFDVGSVGDVRSILLEVGEYTDLLYRKSASEWGSGELVFERV